MEPLNRALTTRVKQSILDELALHQDDNQPNEPFRKYTLKLILQPNPLTFSLIRVESNGLAELVTSNFANFTHFFLYVNHIFV